MYPKKFSSPPSPPIETFVNFLISLKILKLGKRELSPIGSSINFESLLKSFSKSSFFCTKIFFSKFKSSFFINSVSS